ncbi:MAG: hypothetical protein VX938_10325, partial [Myxococcota bacterium]|nr:hypothetical protein [Myxococcota bacterium]
PWACLQPPGDCVFVDNGAFSIRLGTHTPMAPSVFAENAEIWLGMAVEGEPELPRRQVLTTPYAFQALSANDLACTGCVSPDALDFVPATAADIATAIDGLATTVQLEQQIADAIAGLATSEEVDQKTLDAVAGLATSEEVDQKTAIAVLGLATSEEVDQKIIDALGTPPLPPIVQRTADDFSAGTLVDVVVSGSAALPLLTLVKQESGTVDLGTGADGALEVLNGTHIDDGTPKPYTSVHIAPGAVVNVVPNSSGGSGTIDWRVQGTVFVAATASIDVTGAGYAGGAQVNHADPAGFDGHSVGGAGNNNLEPNQGGGGAGQDGPSAASGGGGGGYGSPGETALSAGNGAGPGKGGETYGDDALTELHLGSGGGSGAGDNNGGGSRTHGPGGNGGGAVRIVADEIQVQGGVLANGSPGTASACVSGPCPGSDDGGSGGGSGGSIHLRARVLDLTGSIHAKGGAGGNGHHDGTNTSATAVSMRGGGGGSGRVRLDAVEVEASSDVSPLAGFEGVLQEDAFGGTVPLGTYTSPILDGGAPSTWSTIDWESYGGPGVLVRVQTGATADLADAIGFDDAPLVTRGQDLSTVSS